VLQQVVEVIIKNEHAHAVEEIADTAHDEVLVDGEEEGVIHAAVPAESREERGRWVALVPRWPRAVVLMPDRWEMTWLVP
jgi:hypothetical protein